MTIKEIASLAGVSASTVSKIMNKKDGNITSETRERVLKVIKECHYEPYAKIKTMTTTSSFLIGVLIHEDSEHDGLLSSIISSVRKEGYNAIVCSSADCEDEYKNIFSICSHHVDGIIWDRVAAFNPESKNSIKESKIPYVTIDCNDPYAHNVYSIDYTAMGYAATQSLVSHKHIQIACVVNEDNNKSKLFRKGFEQCLFENKIPFDAKMYVVLKKDSSNNQLFLHNITGAVCINTQIASEIYKQAAFQNLHIPRDISVVCLESENTSCFIPEVSSISLPYKEFGELVCRQLISQIECPGKTRLAFHHEFKVNHNRSIDVPITLRNKKIVVVGAINMDVLVNLGNFPEMGETVITEKRVVIPGGKGLNQALGAARLGAEAYLIGKVGKDYDGSVLYDFLKTNQVNTEGISSDSKYLTGTAYVYVQNDGESSIVIYNGANGMLCVSDIDKHEDMFKNASFCLLQTEISRDVVEYTAQVAKKHGVKVLLKPCAVNCLSDSLLNNVDILIPNKMEIHTLLPQEVSYEEKAQYFLDRGVKTVIITLGHRGCYLRSANESCYFPAADVVPVDTTGAADAFAATLAVYLSKNHDMKTAIQYATYAAGLSTTRQGVPPSLVDQSTLELYLSEKPSIY